MYLNGAAVLEISEYVGLSIKEVNGILDVYVPLMWGKMKKINKLGSCPFCGEKVKEHKFQYNMLQAVCTKCGERWGCLHGKLYW